MSESSELGTYAFKCPACGHVNALKGTVEGLSNCIFSCEDCHEKVLMRGHVEEVDE